MIHWEVLSRFIKYVQYFVSWYVPNFFFILLDEVFLGIQNIIRGKVYVIHLDHVTLAKTLIIQDITKKQIQL